MKICAHTSCVKHVRGFTLLETLISLLLISLSTVASINTQLTAKQHHTKHQALLEIEHHARNFVKQLPIIFPHLAINVLTQKGVQSAQIELSNCSEIWRVCQCNHTDYQHISCNSSTTCSPADLFIQMQFELACGLANVSRDITWRLRQNQLSQSVTAVSLIVSDDTQQDKSCTRSLSLCVEQTIYLTKEKDV